MNVETLRRQARELADDGRLADAHRVYSMLLDDQRQRVGDGHPQTLQILNDLATVQLRLGDFAAARQSAERAAQARTEGLGAEHPDTLRSRFLVGAVLHDAGGVGPARALFEELIPVFDRVFGPSGRGARELGEGLARLVGAAGGGGLARQLEARGGARDDPRAPDPWAV